MMRDIEYSILDGDNCARISERVDPLRQEYLKEFKSELLEIRKGKVASLDFPIASEAEVGSDAAAVVS